MNLKHQADQLLTQAVAARVVGTDTHLHHFAAGTPAQIATIAGLLKSQALVSRIEIGDRLSALQSEPAPDASDVMATAKSAAKLEIYTGRLASIADFAAQCDNLLAACGRAMAEAETL